MARDQAIVTKTMKRVKSKDTSIEIILRKALWKKGFRYRKNYAGLPGKPDIVIPKYRIAIFCDSEFFMERIGTGSNYSCKRETMPIIGLKKSSETGSAIGRTSKS